MRASWQDFRRDFRSGELTLLLLALILAVTATTTLRHFSAGVEKSLAREAARLIGADLVIRSSRPIPADVERFVRARNVDIASTQEFASVLQGADSFQLAAIKAVSRGYPLRGQLKLRRNGQDVLVSHVPAPGTVWLDERLMGLLAVQLGQSITLGERSLRIAAVLAYEPDRGGNFAAFSPRAMMAIEDVASTGVVQPGSRLQYQLMMRAADERELAGLREGLTPRLGPGARLLDVAAGRPELATPLTRATDYLGLAAIAAVVLAGLAIAVSIRRFAERRYDFMALLRCLGASRREVLVRVLGELAIVWSVAILVGALLGGLVSVLISHLLANLLPAGLPVFTVWRPLLTGVATATLCLAGFALPALLSLGKVTPLRVLRRELAPTDLPQAAIMGLSLTALFLLLAIETGRPLLTLIAVGGGTLLALLLHTGLTRLLQSLRGLEYPQLAVLRRQPGQTASQMLGLAIGLTALMLVTSLSDELLSTWQRKMPVGAPNHFVLNIADHELADFESTLRHKGFEHSAIYPVVRGRLTAINGQPVRKAVTKEDAGEGRDESLNRELNLTWSDTLPSSNKLTEGRWWSTGDVGSPAVSIEKRLAERLQIRLGDTLTFTLAEGTVTATVRSLREVDWDSFQPNFYMIFPTGVIDGFPASWMTSFHVPEERRPLLNDVVKAFPTVILIDIASVMTEVKRMLDQVSQAVEAVLLFVLLAGLLVITAHVNASLDARRFESALLRVFGAGKRELQWRLLTEFILIGVLSGVLAAVMTECLSAVIYWRVMDLDPVFHPALWWQAPLAGAALVSMAGLAGARRVWSTSPMLTLRQG